MAWNKQGVAFLFIMWARLSELRTRCSALTEAGEKLSGFESLAKRLEELELLILEKKKMENKRA